MLESQNVIKTLVPKLSPRRFEAKGDHDHSDGEHQSKVCGRNLQYE